MGELHTCPFQHPHHHQYKCICHKSKTPWIKLMHKDQRLPKNLSGSNGTQMRLKMWPETLIFYCRGSTCTKNELSEVGFAARVLWILFNGSGTQSRTQRFEQNSKRSKRARNRLWTEVVLIYWAEFNRRSKLEPGCEDYRHVILISKNPLLQKRLDSGL